jgi:hypothetical protein
MLIDQCRSSYVDIASQVVGNVDGLSGTRHQTMVTAVVRGRGLYVLVRIGQQYAVARSRRARTAHQRSTTTTVGRERFHLPLVEMTVGQHVASFELYASTPLEHYCSPVIDM